MKDKILHIELLVAVFVAAFFIGRNTVETTVETEDTNSAIEVMKVEDVIKLLNSVLNKEYVNIYDITGWECWEADGKVNLEIEDWVISKEPYALDTTITKIEY